MTTSARMRWFGIVLASTCVAIEGRCDLSVPVPEAVKRALIEQTKSFVVTIYPKVDPAWLHKDLENVYFRDVYAIQSYGAQGCGVSYSRNADRTLKLSAQIPPGWMIIGCTNTLPGEPTPQELETPLTIDEARTNATTVLERIFSLVGNAAQIQLTEQYGFDEGAARRGGKDNWGFVWSGKDRLGLPTEVTVIIRARDGLVIRCKVTPGWDKSLPDPKLTRAQALEKAKALPGRIDEKNLSLSIRCYYAERRLVWQYMPPPNPSAGVLQRNYGIWDAVTGDLLESDRLNGAKPEYNTYRNPEFFFEPTEANVKANLEKNLKKWAEELEAKAAKAPEAKPPEGK